MSQLIIWLSKFLQGSNIRRNTLMTFNRQLAAAAAQLLLVIAIARELGPEGNGLYAMAILVPSMLSTFLNLGVAPATVYFVGRAEVDGRQASNENLKLAVIVSSIGIILAAPILYYYGKTLFPDVSLLLLLIGLSIFPLSLLLSYWNSVLQGLENFRAFNWTVLAPPLTTLLLTFITLYGLNLDITAAVLAYAIGQACGVLVVWRYIRLLPNSKPLSAPGNYKRHVLTYGWKAHLSNVMAFINYRADIFLVNFFLSPISTGIYVIAVQMSEKLWMLSQAASTVLLPRLSAMRSDPIERYKITMRTSFIIGVLTLVASLILALALYFLLEPFFGEDYKASLSPFLWLLPGVVVGAVSRIQSNCIAAAGKPEWNFYSSLIVVSLNIAFNVILIPVYGIIGAALSTTIAYTINAIIKFFMIRKTLKLNN
ncbi:flippase [Nitrincola alkalilacustris]|uniref:flippase n=1 Tax=Nitrincola alkalilacustris TaxID=1571224 RepID=UPI00124F43F5|nr:flippase [Nitrincola alkalilacustris]